MFPLIALNATNMIIEEADMRFKWLCPIDCVNSHKL